MVIFFGGGVMGQLDIFQYGKNRVGYTAPTPVNPTHIRYGQIETRFDADSGISWVLMNPKGVPCFNLDLLDELQQYNQSIEDCRGEIIVNDKAYPVNYMVFASLTPHVFNLGGQLELFIKLIRNSDRQALLHYATMCVDSMASRAVHYNLPVVTISLVQGEALGGGFEAVLTSDIIIAERSSRMGFPEILFNLFPGMGAFSFLARKIGAAMAEKIILSGKLYSAEELQNLGVVDVVVEDGEGEKSIYDYVAKQARRSNGYIAVQKARQRFNPVTRQELMDITNIWVDAALKLGEKDMKVMERLVRSQQKIFRNQITSQPMPVDVSCENNAQLALMG